MRSWPGFLPPLVALAATVLATFAFAVAGSGPASAEYGAGAVALALVPVVLAIAVVWAAAMVTARPHRLAPAAAVVWVAVALPLWGGGITWPVAAYVAAGLVAGWALGARWRLDVALAGIVLTLLPLSIWTVVQMPVGDQLAAFRTQMVQGFEQGLPAGADEDQRREALARAEESFESVLAVAQVIYPAALGLELLAESLLVLVLGWLAVRLLGWRLPSWRPPPFARWRLPFYLVWVLVAGLGLLITRQQPAAAVGLNVALFAAVLLSIQGVAVQFFVTTRLFRPPGRFVFWTLTGLFLAPVIVLSGALLGLADQWLDLRGLERGSDKGRGGDVDDSAGDADDVGRRDR